MLPVIARQFSHKRFEQLVSIVVWHHVRRAVVILEEACLLAVHPNRDIERVAAQRIAAALLRRPAFDPVRHGTTSVLGQALTPGRSFMCAASVAEHCTTPFRSIRIRASRSRRELALACARPVAEALAGSDLVPEQSSGPVVATDGALRGRNDQHGGTLATALHGKQKSPEILALGAIRLPALRLGSSSVRRDRWPCTGGARPRGPSKHAHRSARPADYEPCGLRP